MPTSSSNTAINRQHSVYTTSHGITTQRTVNVASEVIRWSRTWARTAGFKRLAARRDLPVNNFSYWKDYYSGANGTLTRWGTNPPSTWNYVGDGLGTYAAEPDVSVPGYSAAAIAAADSRNITKLLLKLKDQKVNSLQAFSEREQTKRLLANTAKRISESVRALKRGDFVSAAKSLGVVPSKRARRRFSRDWNRRQSEAVSSGWLELQYGWVPLLSDVYGSAELLAQRRSHEIRNRVSATTTLNSEYSTSLYRNVSFPGVETKQVRQHYVVKHVVYFASTESVPHTLSQMGISNPALIAWELLPWSFVVDWFIPIGNYLSSLDATLGLSFEKGSRTVFQVNSCQSVRQGTHGNAKVGGTSCDLRYNFNQVKCERTKLLSFPRTVLPDFKNPLSTEHALNAIALLITTFKR